MYIIFDLKHKFCTRGFREGGNAYYGTKRMQWFGMGACVKPAATAEPTHELDPGQCVTAATTEDHNVVGTEQVDHVSGRRCEQTIEPDGYHDCEQEEEYEDYEECDNDDLQDYNFDKKDQEEYKEYEECDEDYGDNESDNDHNNNGDKCEDCVCEEDD